MDPAFPLCRDPRCDEPVRRVIAACADFLRERMRGRLVGLVLTGSFSRGEGSVVPVNGHLRVLGDIEFLVVVPRDSDYRTLRRRMGAWSREAAARLGPAHRLAVDLEFGPVDIRYMHHRARPSIFVHDLATHGKVVWGPADLLQAIPPFATDGIPPEDAVNLVFNRTIEQLEAWDRLETVEGEGLLDVAYHQCKLVLDLAGSALAFAGAHTSSYAHRPARFADLVARHPALGARLPATFPLALERAARLKLEPTADSLLPAGDAAAQRAWLRQRMVETVPTLAALLAWELEQMLGARESLAELLARFLTAQGLRRRARDWARIALHPMPAPLPLSPIRAARLFCRSTPRALVYGAGVLAYLALGHDGRVPADVSRLLPLPRARTPRTPAAQRQAIVAFWRWCIRNH